MTCHCPAREDLGDGLACQQHSLVVVKEAGGLHQAEEWVLEEQQQDSPPCGGWDGVGLGWGSSTKALLIR